MSPSCPIEKVSTSEKIDETEKEIQFKKPPKKSAKGKLYDEDDTRRYSTSDTQIVSYLLDVPDAVTIQYQEGGELATGTQSVSLQVSIPSYQNITEEAVIEAEASRSKEGQVVEEVVPKRPFLDTIREWWDCLKNQYRFYHQKKRMSKVQKYLWYGHQKWFME